MNQDPSASLPLPVELRVHGVGGPQAVKMLGEVSEHEVVTVPPFCVGPVGQTTGSASDERMPKDTETRFVRRLTGDQTEAYEWGALTVASATKALWVLYLPFTLINAGGWAHAPNIAMPVGTPWKKVRRSVRCHLRLSHVLAYLATLTYVAWISYLTLEVIARAWVDHVRAGNEADGVLADVVLVWVPRLAPLVCAALVIGLFVAPVHKGRFEEVRGADPGVDTNAQWAPVPSLEDAGFFAHERSHRRRLRWHVVVSAAGLAAALIQFMVGWNHLGEVLLALAATQAVVLTALAIVDLAGRWWRTPSEVFAADLIRDEHLANGASRMPAGAAFATIGTVLAHAAFAGLALTLAPFLARWPKDLNHDRLQLGAELGATDVLTWMVVLLVVFAAVILVASAKVDPESNVAGVAKSGPIVRLARRAPELGGAALAAAAIPVAVYLYLNIRGALDETGCSGAERVTCWYDNYVVADSAIAKRLGSFLLLLLPGAVYSALWRNHETGFGRVVGNMWDVLTFWPRRFHPHGAPCSAERSVPELRARIRHVVVNNRGQQVGSGLVVVAHSQGSVLSVTAIASMRPDEPVPALVTFGSPLGTLYAPTWPAYIPPVLAKTGSAVRSTSPGRPWVNFWRSTDPVGAQVPGAHNEHLSEPQADSDGNLEAIRGRPPLERPTRWGTVAGHGRYLADPEVRAAIECRRIWPPPR